MARFELQQTRDPRRTGAAARLFPWRGARFEYHASELSYGGLLVSGFVGPVADGPQMGYELGDSGRAPAFEPRQYASDVTAGVDASGLRGGAEGQRAGEALGSALTRRGVEALWVSSAQ